MRAGARCRPEAADRFACIAERAGRPPHHDDLGTEGLAGGPDALVVGGDDCGDDESFGGTRGVTGASRLSPLCAQRHFPSAF